MINLPVLCEDNKNRQEPTVQLTENDICLNHHSMFIDNVVLIRMIRPLAHCAFHTDHTFSILLFSLHAIYGGLLFLLKAEDFYTVYST